MRGKRALSIAQDVGGNSEALVGTGRHWKATVGNGKVDQYFMTQSKGKKDRLFSS